ncbi:MAG: uroporphyrinogen decarboxylase [Oscillospiraceae bacterium]|nr:uroporphyrinogen decarboxylase [Oscillospiraceae bacterium]
MSQTVEAIRRERTENTQNIYDDKIPARVPISVSLAPAVIAGYAGIDIRAAYWKPSLLKEPAIKLAEMIGSDAAIYGGSIYTPVSSQTLRSINKVMSSTGYMQHPNTVCMEPDEYDELIADPYAFIIEKCIPRLYKSLDPQSNPWKNILPLLQESQLRAAVAREDMELRQELNERFGYPAPPRMNGGMGRVAMDWLADQLRSFSGICIDVRRNRAKLIEALEAIYPMIYKIGVAKDLNNIDRYSSTGFQLHMATYLREKDFAEVWLPTWKRQVEDYASLGMRISAFLEEDWDRLLDYVYELPAGSVFSFEKTDAKLLKEKLGKKFILSGGFPLQHLTQCTKDEIIGKTKDWLDIMAPGGRYIFGFDKGAITHHDVNVENLIAVCDTVREYGTYDNPGAATGEAFDKSIFKHSELPQFKSKYYKTWEQYLAEFPYTPDEARSMVMQSEDAMLATMFSMTC